MLEDSVDLHYLDCYANELDLDRAIPTPVFLAMRL